MKPIVFNYGDYEKVVEENKKLKAEVANLLIRCRIAESDKRDCNNCKHNKPDGCSRWDCEYEPKMVEVVRCKDCKYWQDNNGGYPNQNCRWNEQETPDADDFCSFAERREP